MVFQIKTAHFRVAFYCDQPEAHLCSNHTPVRWMDYPGKREMLTNMDFNKFLDKIRKKEALCLHEKQEQKR